MYKQFYGLKRNPFEISPDPSFFCSTPGHYEALAALYYGVQRRKGFIVLTGEVGTGKTLLLRCMSELLRRAQVDMAYVFNPRLSEMEFLRYLMTDLRLPVSGNDKSAMLFQLNDYLLARHAQGTTTVVIIDEAHLLSWQLLEEVRLLTNMETPRQKLLQIILVGQPELDHRIDSPDLRQLNQRIGLRRKLTPLTGAEMQQYILRRLELASAKTPARMIFSKLAVDAIQKYSRGIPRLANTLCENALVSGYAHQLPIITGRIVEEVATEFGFDRFERSRLDVNVPDGTISDFSAIRPQVSTVEAAPVGRVRGVVRG
ncbi:MAG TPA: AAA family ATPase [Terriglobales bacterium]